MENRPPKFANQKNAERRNGTTPANEEDLLAQQSCSRELALTLPEALIRDTLPQLLEVNTQAHEKFEALLLTESALGYR